MVKTASKAKKSRPSQGISESAVLVRAPVALLELAQSAADAAGVTRSEWIREAMRRESSRACVSAAGCAYCVERGRAQCLGLKVSR